MKFATPKYRSKRNIDRHTSGFTLLEIMVAIGLATLLFTVGGVKYIDFNKTQTIKSAGQTFKNNLRAIQGKAQAGVKPTSCSTTEILNGYDVKYATNTSYLSVAICNSTNKDTVTYTVPSGIYINSITQFRFQPVAQGTNNTSTIILKNTSGSPIASTKWYSLCIAVSGDIRDCGYTTGSSQPICSC